MGGAISLSDILSYCDLYGFEDRQFFAEVMRAMDTALLSKQSEKRDREQQQQKQGQQGGGRG